MALWWQEEGMLGDLQDILTHFNASTFHPYFRNTDICKMLFDALNKAWTAFSLAESDFERSDSASFAAMIKRMNDECIEKLLSSKEVSELSKLQPLILDHSTLKKGGYRPNTAIKPELRESASSQHREFNQWYAKYISSPPKGKGELLSKLARILYVVRSNIAHGEKTPYGPDSKKMKRDESVCGTVVPVQRKLLNLLLDNPDNKLAVYGTLAPKEPNEYLLKDLDGVWKDCIIRGRIEKSGGLKYFQWIPSGGEVRAKIIFSTSLPDRMPRLESFEGGGYRRIWIPALVEDAYHVANVFCRKENY